VPFSGHCQCELHGLVLVDLSVNDGVAGLHQCATHPGTGLDSRINQLLSPDRRSDADGCRDGVCEPPPSLEIDARHGEENHLRGLAFNRSDTGRAAMRWSTGLSDRCHSLAEI